MKKDALIGAGIVGSAAMVGLVGIIGFAGIIGIGAALLTKKAYILIFWLLLYFD